jgi:translation initiation factor IF-3
LCPCRDSRTIPALSGCRGARRSGPALKRRPLASARWGLYGLLPTRAAADVFSRGRSSGTGYEERRIVQGKRVRRNEEIATSEVRLIGANGEQIGVMPTQQALEHAVSAGMDLVEVAPNSEPPVCRVMDYGKFVFEQNKKAQSARRKQKQIHIKEVKFRPGTEEGDYQVKLRNLIRFLSQGDKTKVTLRFRGREMAHQELGVELLQRVQKDLDEYGTVEQKPLLEGRQMVMVIAPRKR